MVKRIDRSCLVALASARLRTYSSGHWRFYFFNSQHGRGCLRKGADLCVIIHAGVRLEAAQASRRAWDQSRHISG